MLGIFCGYEGLVLWLRRGEGLVPGDQWLASAILTGALMLLLVLLFSLRDSGWRESLGLVPFRMASSLGWAALGVLAVYGTSLVVGALCHFARVDMKAQLRLRIEVVLKFAEIPSYAILPLVAFVGFWEETVFRGFLLGRVRAFLSSPGGTPGPLRDALAILVTAALFGIGHIYQGPLGVLQTSMIGLVLGTLTLWRKSVWPAVLAHLTIDGITFSAVKLVAPFLREWLQNQPPI